MTFNHEYLSGTYKIVDLSWYAPYKEYGDNIICMFAYLAFIWHLFVKAASIINGVDSAYTTTVDTEVFSNFGNKGGK